MPYDTLIDLEANPLMLCVCVRFVRLDGTVFAFTTHDLDIELPETTVGSITIPATTFIAAGGLLMNDDMSSDGLQPDNSAASLFIDDTYATDEDIAAGLWNDAAYTLLIVNARNPAQRPIIRARGTIGDVAQSGIEFTGTLLSLVAPFQQEIVERTSANCRWTLGDANCGFDLNGNTFNPDGSDSGYPATLLAAVSTVTDRYTFAVADAIGFPAHYFRLGHVSFDTGANALSNYSWDVEEFDAGSGEFVLSFPLPFDLAPGDEIRAVVGDDKRVETCHDRFNRVRYFGGEPGLKTVDMLVETENV